MNQYFRIVGIAVLAMLALAVSSASAAKFTAATYPTEVTGESRMEAVTFKTEAGTFECAFHSKGVLAASSEVLTLTTTLNCSSAFFGMKISMNGCTFSLALPTGSVDTYSATSGVTCPAGQVIVVEIGGSENYCQFTIPSQTNMGKIDIANDTVKGDVQVRYANEKMEYTVTFDKIGCPLSGTGTKNGGGLVQDVWETLDSTNGATINVG